MASWGYYVAGAFIFFGLLFIILSVLIAFYGKTAVNVGLIVIGSILTLVGFILFVILLYREFGRTPQEKYTPLDLSQYGR